MTNLKYFVGAVLAVSTVLSAQAWAQISEGTISTGCNSQCSGQPDEARCLADCTHDLMFRRQPTFNGMPVSSTAPVQSAGASTISTGCNSQCSGQPDEARCLADCTHDLMFRRQPGHDQASVAMQSTPPGARSDVQRLREEAQASARTFALAGTDGISNSANELNIVSACQAYRSDRNNRVAIDRIRLSYQAHHPDARVPALSYCTTVQENAAAIESACSTLLNSSDIDQGLGSVQEAVSMVAIMSSNDGEQLDANLAKQYCSRSGFLAARMPANDSRVADAGSARDIGLLDDGFIVAPVNESRSVQGHAPPAGSTGMQYLPRR